MHFRLIILFFILTITPLATKAEGETPNYLAPTNFEVVDEEEIKNYIKFWATSSALRSPSKLGKLAKSEKVIAEFASNPKTKIFADILKCDQHFGKGELDKSYLFLSQLRNAHPKNLSITFTMGRLLYTQRRHMEAEKYFLRFINAFDLKKNMELVKKTNFSTRVSWAHYYLSRIYMKCGQESKCKKMIETAKEYGEMDILTTSSNADAARLMGPKNWDYDKGAFRVDTDHFIVLTNVKKKFCELMASRAEAFLKLIEKDFKTLLKKKKNKDQIVIRPTIIIFDKKRDIKNFNTEVFGEHFFSRGDAYFDKDTNIIAIYNENKSDDSMWTVTVGKPIPEVERRLYKCLTHFFLDQYVDNVPYWYREGLGYKYENTRVKGKSGKLDRICQVHLEWIRDYAQGVNWGGTGRLKDALEIMELNDGFDEGWHGEDHMCIFHFFMHHKIKGINNDLLGAMMNGICDNKRLMKIVVDRFKTEEKLNKAWKKFCAQMR